MVHDGQLQYMDGIQSKRRDIHLEFEYLEQGSYYIFVEFDWAADVSSFAMTTYG